MFGCVISAITIEKWCEQSEFLDKMKSFIGSIKIILNKNEKSKTVYAFNGFLQNINAIQEFSNEIFKESDESAFTLTGILNRRI